MFGIDYKLISIFLLIPYLYCEVLHDLTLKNINQTSKNFLYADTKKKIQINIKSNLYSLIINSTISIVLFSKHYESNVFFTYIILYVFILRYAFSFIDQYMRFIQLNIILFFFLTLFINNFIILYLSMELYCIIFYFFFLTNIDVNLHIKLINLKNMIIYYLFNNFLISILFLFSLQFVIQDFGTLNFFELNMFVMKTLNIYYYILILCLFLKLALPGYHFLKIEIYKYLPINNVVHFSTITLIINLFYVYTMFNCHLIYFTINSFKLFGLLLIFSFIILIQKLKVNTFQEFIAYSGFTTNVLILLNFVI